MTKISEIKLAVFDFDATIMDGETINFLAKEANVENEVSEITHLAMNGEIDFFESLIKFADTGINMFPPNTRSFYK